MSSSHACCKVGWGHLQHLELMERVWYLRVRLVGGVEKWKGRKLVGGWKRFSFPRVCLVGGVEKWEGGKIFCLVEKKSGRIENVVNIN